MACTRTRTTLQNHKLEIAGILYEPRLCPEEDKVRQVQLCSIMKLSAVLEKEVGQDEESDFPIFRRVTN